MESTERINVCFSHDLLDKLDAFAESANLSRSRAAELLINASLDGEGFEVVRKVRGRQIHPDDIEVVRMTGGDDDTRQE